MLKIAPSKNIYVSYRESQSLFKLDTKYERVRNYPKTDKEKTNDIFMICKLSAHFDLFGVPLLQSIK